MIEKHRVTQFYTAPTAIRMLHKSDPTAPKNSDLSSLKVLGSVGEPIDPEAWGWFYKTVGDGHCPIVDTWWQTETGGHMISPLAAITPTKPSSATLPLPGIGAEVLDINGSAVSPGDKGLLCITKPWPSMLRTVWGSPDRYEKTYFSIIQKNGRPVYFTGDEAFIDDDGYFVITGRADDVINISGHRVGTAEVESVIAKHPNVAECAIVSKPDATRGERIAAFVVLRDGNDAGAAPLLIEVNKLMRSSIGAIVQVTDIHIVPGLPKTRSGKILRRILRSLVRLEPLTTDMSTLEDPDIVRIITEAIEQENELK